MWKALDADKKLEAWQKSVKAYEIALKSDSELDKKETLANYEFVKKEIEKLKKKMEEEKKKQVQKNDKDQKPQNNDKKWTDDKDFGKSNDTWSWSKEQSPSTANNDQNNPSPKSWTSKWNFNPIWQNWDENKQEMSPEEQKELKDYSQYLKQFQKENLNNIQKWAAPSPQDALNGLLNIIDPDFQNEVNATDKDW